MKRYATWYNNLGDNFMIQIPDNSTILAPATLHLSLYKEILKQKAGYLLFIMDKINLTLKFFIYTKML